ncbi:hypothetical protein TFKS16_0904 [Tannerella forsythia KS16]|nr:hypothetical protein TFKS16_0904 [Tannerella forsythia KS16]
MFFIKNTKKDLYCKKNPFIFATLFSVIRLTGDKQNGNEVRQI